MEKAKSIYESAERTVKKLKEELLELEKQPATRKSMIEKTKKRLLSAEKCLSDAEDRYGDYLGCDIYESAERTVKRIRDEIVKLETKHAAERIEYARLVQNCGGNAALRNMLPNPDIYYSLQMEKMKERLEDRLEVNQELNRLRLEREALKEERLVLKNQLRETMESMGFWVSDSLDEIILLKPS